ncbi:P-loop containing nucleoside triphosphate hydrolase protein [Ascobolus immersus RN42]|uniref:Kinesin-like protein n=1 Tax=Ascobolus immersus RN42 TaxID=1160509 RepID=A0A3N4IMS4_ASCIM|nr:P-loop containing nucleoside triphosphate hydrolase protein [Ascobolus immersus RN42]
MDRPKTPHTADATAHLFDVFLRLRPSTNSTDAPFLQYKPGQPQVSCTPTGTDPSRKRSRGIEKFSFTQVFDERCKQRDVFTDVALPLLAEVVKGHDGMLATLGVTGSGKTHTILGSQSERGMTQLALDVLFRSIGDRLVDPNRFDMAGSDTTEGIVMDALSFQESMSAIMDTHIKRASLASMPKRPDVSDIVIDLDQRSRYAVLISMYEVYNDRIFDLLDDKSLTQPQTRRKALMFRKCEGGDPKKVVAGLRKVYVRNMAEALTVLEHGQACRHASPTNLNSQSSRSHAFFCIEVKRIPSRGGLAHMRSATLHIVDLAGSERAKHSHAAGERLAEAGSINRSLMSLGQCLQLQTTTENGRPVAVPYRQSKLTELLFTNSFIPGASQKASMIVTADPRGDTNATIQILRYSALARDVTLPPRTRGRNASSASDYSMTSDASYHHGDSHAQEMIANLMARLEESELARQELEEKLKEAQERLEQQEQELRDEIAVEMEDMMEEMEQAYMQQLQEAEKRYAAHTDKKLDLLRGALQKTELVNDEEHEEKDAYVEDLERENEQLLAEIRKLRRENQQLGGSMSVRGNRVKRGAGKNGIVLSELENLNLVEHY